jgi:hypothetical protein
MGRRSRALLATVIAMSAIALTLAIGPASATTPPGSIAIANQAQLLADGSVVLTVTYTCAPAAGNITTGTLATAVQQGATIGNGDAVATCDNRKHTANIQNIPGPFSQGIANAVAEVQNADATSFAFTSRGVMVH